MELSKLMTLNDNEKLEYLRNKDTELDENTKIQVLKSFKDNNLKIACLNGKNINLRLKGKLSFWLYLADIDISEDYSKKLEEIYESLLQTSNQDEKIECLNNESLILNSYMKKDLIKSLENDRLKIDYLTNPNMELEIYYKVEIIESLKDEQLKVDCLVNPDIELESSDKSEIISSIKDELLKVGCLTNPDIELDSFDKAKVVLSIEDDRIKIDCLTNADIGLDFSDKSELAISLMQIVLSLKDDESKMSCIMNSAIGLNSFEKARVIVSLKDENLKISCLNNQDIDIQSSGRAMIISSLEDDEKKISYIQDLNMNFNEKDKLLIICSLKDKNKFEKFGITPDYSYKKSIELPPNMTIGVELEAEGEYAEPFKTGRKILNGWEVEHESTLERGVEVKSPVLHSTKEDMYLLATVCNIMQKLDLNTNENCGRTYTFWCYFFRK